MINVPVKAIWLAFPLWTVRRDGPWGSATPACWRGSRLSGEPCMDPQDWAAGGSVLQGFHTYEGWEVEQTAHVGKKTWTRVPLADSPVGSQNSKRSSREAASPQGAWGVWWAAGCGRREGIAQRPRPPSTLLPAFCPGGVAEPPTQRAGALSIATRTVHATSDLGLEPPLPGMSEWSPGLRPPPAPWLQPQPPAPPRTAVAGPWVTAGAGGAQRPSGGQTACGQPRGEVAAQPETAYLQVVARPQGRLDLLADQRLV